MKRARNTAGLEVRLALCAIVLARLSSLSAAPPESAPITPDKPIEPRISMRSVPERISLAEEGWPAHPALVGRVRADTRHRGAAAGESPPRGNNSIRRKKISVLSDWNKMRPSR